MMFSYALAYLLVVNELVLEVLNMTRQFHEKFELDGKIYEIVNFKRNWFRPILYGLKSRKVCTACWSGYLGYYGVKDGTLYLIDLRISTENDVYPRLNGVERTRLSKDNLFAAHYKNVFLDFKFTGKVVLGRDIDIKCLQGEFIDPWMYKEVKELTFKEGQLVLLEDKSEEMKLIRDRNMIRKRD